MAQLRIAPEERAAVAALTKLSDVVIAKLADGLEKAEPTIRSVSKVFAATLGEENEYLARPLAAMAFLVATTTDVTARVVNDDLKDTLGGEAGEGDLTPLLDSKTLATLSKTIDLRTAHERVLQNFRIVTDVRPVFDKQIGPIASAIVTHSARLTFAVNDRLEELFVALNHNDLVEIQDVVARALDKEQRSHDFIESRGGHVLDSHKETE